jgi:hypothetical protein
LSSFGGLTDPHDAQQGVPADKFALRANLRLNPGVGHHRNMARYAVMLHGHGIRFPFEDGKLMIGFYTSRVVTAASAEEAVEKAKAQVTDLWTSAEYATQNQGSLPVLETEKVAEVSWWQARKIPTKGHTFYANK